MPKNYADQIAKIKEKREKLDARLNTLDQKAKDESRKRETRQKIIVGGAVLAEMEKDDDFAASIRVLLARYVARPRDKETLGDILPPVKEPPAASLSEVGGEMSRLLDPPTI
jgi:hypothetical protein